MILTFTFNSIGNGQLQLIDQDDGDIVILSMPYKTGVVDADGDLTGGIKHGTWYIDTKPFHNFFQGWKIHLTTPQRQASSYCIHGDVRCDCKMPHIVPRLRCNYRLLRKKIEQILKTQDTIEFIVKGE